MGQIKVVWICSFSNSEVREELKKKTSFLSRIFHKKYFDSAQWNTNAIKEFENIKEVDLHIICPVRGIRASCVNYDKKGIHYHFFRDEYSNVIKRFLRLFNRYSAEYRGNRRSVKKLVDSIKPDIVHLIGAECFHFSKSILEIPNNIPIIAQLQTLVHDPTIIALYKNRKKFINYRIISEQSVLERADYIGANELHYKNIIYKYVDKNACMINIGLALAEPIDISECEKTFDFVYFASSIKKAGDIAIEAFGEAFKKNPKITIDIIGGYDVAYKQHIDSLVKKLNIEDAVTFEGKLHTHEDVINQVKKSRFALLPIKADTISGTIRESMSLGLPVVTCITDGTPLLNMKRESVLISPFGDIALMSQNMLKLVNDDSFASTIRCNAFKTVSELYDNKAMMKRWVYAYNSCINNFYHGSNLPDDLLL